MKPVFIISLPRSGSTLLQRMLASHEDICTAAEPWVLLPYIYSTKRDGVFAEYGHKSLVSAVEDFYASFPDGKSTYWNHLHNFVIDLYKEKCGKDVEYFIDKTPRYHLVIEELMEIFPESRFIFLWRNPLSISASIMETWAKGKWNLHRYTIDLYKGFENMHEMSRKYSDRILNVKYEELLNNSGDELQRIQRYIGVDVSDNLHLDFINNKIDGRMGDPYRNQGQSGVDNASMYKWQKCLGNLIRRYWARRYLKWLGKERLYNIGYDYDTIFHDLNKSRGMNSFLLSDIFRMMYGIFYPYVEPHVLKQKYKVLKSKGMNHSLR